MDEAERKHRRDFRSKVDNKLIARVQIQKTAWYALINDLLKDLDSQEDVSLRSLSQRLDYNSFYKK